MTGQKKILVLGAYGFIGVEVCRRLRRDHDVRGLGRNPEQATRVLPGVPFRVADLNDLVTPADWVPVVQDIDVVVNCAGALQEGGATDLTKLHATAIAALAEACATMGLRLIQISAAGARKEAATEFMRSKAVGDHAILDHLPEAHILRPGLVLGHSSFGGTRLLRMLAAVPVVQPVALGESPIQSVSMDDLTGAVSAAITDQLAPGIYDLVEADAQSLRDVLLATRAQLGFAAPRRVIQLPNWALSVTRRGADGLGRLGWRSPLRSTAIAVLADGVRGDPAPYRQAMGKDLQSLAQILQDFPMRREHRLDARMALFLPVAVALLSLFWLISGVVGLWQLNTAAEVLVLVGWPAALAKISVVFWSLVDLALAGLILWRPWAGRACLAMAGVALFYLLAATVTAPGLWADPLGPLAKILPVLLASVATYWTLEER
ncbi:SDR family oxidoreductase [Epibacterium ulvae]|uniref:SDR family oxidoreductase n=1 Tax=Epibacterium ulvae TaxID=1156985 RepID=UPI00248FF749|nr:SDR family oxidoreductase [Epibacterium ulvae]